VVDPTIDGGVIGGGPFAFTVGDGVVDNVSGITLTGNVGTNSTWVVTDAQSNILGLPPTLQALEGVDFDVAGDGICLIWHLSYEDGLQGAAVGNNAADLVGTYDLSNSIEVIRTPVSTGPDCTFATPIATALPSINNSQFNFVYVLGNGGPNLDNVTNFTINWDLNNNGLYQFSMGTNNGIPDWYNDLRGNLTQSFNSVQPEATLTGTGFPDNGNTDPVADIFATPTSGDAPLLVSLDGSGSTDADGDALTYSWDFGDGTGANGVTVENIFTAFGNYTVTLTVDDGNGGSAQATVAITVRDGDIIIDPPPGNAYIDRFVEMRNKFYDPANGYFSADGSPHHSIETLIVEAPDHGHESTSELYSYWLWLEAMHGRVSGDWTPLNNVWNKVEEFIIPTTADQPTNAAYNPSAPAAYAAEFPLPSDYPAPLEFSAPVGVDPVSPDLTAAYGADIYQMHWLLDNDNFYGYGNRGDGVSTPSYINTFQRGEQESVYETIPHPSWESFDWGGT